MALHAGSRLGPYEIIAAAGAGGMGEVYRARDTRLDRTVAIKVLPSDVAANAEIRERFEREARAVAALNHPHICTLHDVGHQDGVDFLVMEFLEGETLAERLRKGAVPIPQALEYAIQIADALDKAHRAGIIHRDLKPGNIMLTKSGAKLLDFGLAKAGVPGAGKSGVVAGGAPALASASARVSMMPTEATPLTVEGAILGTLQYMAPEQLEGREADARTDIFAFGGVLYEMVTGHRAFQGRSQVSLMAAIIDKDPPPISEVQPLSPPLLEHLVRTCLAKNPDARWQHAGDLLIQLKLIGEQGVSGEATLAPAPSKRQARIAWVAAALFLLTTVALAGLMILRVDAPEPAKISFDVATPPAPSPLHIALSPGGTHVVANASDGGLPVLWLRALEHRDGQFLAHTENASFPFWSPDGRSIAFFGDGKLKAIDLLGSPPRILCDAVGGHGGTWSSQNVIVFAPTQRGPLFRVSAAGGTPEQVTELDASQGETAHRHPFFLPDGDHFLYTAVSSKSGLSAVYVGSLSSQERKRLVESTLKAAFAPPEHLLFMGDNSTLMAQRFDAGRVELVGDRFPVIADDVAINLTNSAAGFTVSANGILTYRGGLGAGRRVMTLYDAAGRQSATVGAPAVYQSPAISPDSERVAVFRQDGSAGDIWIFDLVRGTSSRFTFDAATDTAPIWSADGTRVVFSSNRDGAFDLYVKNAGGGGQEEVLFKSDHAKLADHWSHDGRFVVYRDEDPKTGWDVWVLPLDGDRKPRPLLQTPFREIQGRFSPDGRLLAYVSDETGRDEVYVQSFPQSGGKWQISTSGGVQPRWRRDGREMYFHALDNEVMAVEVSGTSEDAFKAGVPRRLFPAMLATRVTDRNNLDAALDGQRFLIIANENQATQAVGQLSTITIVVNWLAPQNR